MGLDEYYIKQGRPTPPEALSRALSVASKEASRLTALQHNLTPKQASISSFHLAGADVAARQRVFDTAREGVSRILGDPELQSWELEQKLEDAKHALLEELRTAGLFRFDVRPFIWTIACAGSPFLRCSSKATLCHGFTSADNSDQSTQCLQGQAKFWWGGIPP